MKMYHFKRKKLVVHAFTFFKLSPIDALIAHRLFTRPVAVKLEWCQISLTRICARESLTNPWCVSGSNRSYPATIRPSPSTSRRIELLGLVHENKKVTGVGGSKYFAKTF
jgi:hypothetical protein